MSKFKTFLSRKVHIHALVVFGSRARGDGDEDSDLDVLVVTEEPEDREVSEYVSTCAWEACFGSGIILSPVLISKNDWETGPERYSLLGLAVRKEGIPV